MNSQRTAVKLGGRLSQLGNMLQQQYAIIWDCCCDHGLLGMSLLQRKQADKVVFVDILKPQMALLESELQQRFPKSDYDWQVVCQDLREVRLPPIKPQLFVIAGVGGNKTIEFINSLCAGMPELPFDLLLCSVHGNYAMRKALMNQGFYLRQEQIILENKRFYEAIYVTKNAGEAIVATGSDMWDFRQAHHQAYLQRTLQHYRKKAAANSAEFRAVVDEYERLLPGALGSEIKDKVVG
jgi:tRNA (adenine22-N1)-methyltransferase